MLALMPAFLFIFCFSFNAVSISVVVLAAFSLFSVYLSYQFQKIWSKAVYKESGRGYIGVKYFLGGKLYATLFKPTICATGKCGKPKVCRQSVSHLHSPRQDVPVQGVYRCRWQHHKSSSFLAKKVGTSILFHTECKHLY